MNGTPRLRSAYPSSPGLHRRHTRNMCPLQGLRALDHRCHQQHPPRQIPPPMIPFTLIDAPSQRLYAFLFYAGLNIWRFTDFFGLVTDETESLWLFMKWLAIDSVFLYGLPEFQIPWLQWSSSTTAILVISHTFMNAFLMFRIPVCLSPSPPCFARTCFLRPSCRYPLPHG